MFYALEDIVQLCALYAVYMPKEASAESVTLYLRTLENGASIW